MCVDENTQMSSLLASSLKVTDLLSQTLAAESDPGGAAEAVCEASLNTWSIVD